MKQQANAEVQIREIERERVTVAIVGTSPLICNRMSEKAKRQLTLPSGRKTAADKAQSLKHDLLAEFRASPYTLSDHSAPTLLAFLAVSAKKAMMTAALDTPGAKKAQIGRLIRAEGERIPLYGVPQMLVSVVRSADMNRTPDVRSRAILPHWAVLVDLTYPKTILKQKSVLNLLVNGGFFAGVGDWRAEKGSGNYGSFRVAGVDDPELVEIMQTGDRPAQIAAMNSPECYDQDTEELLTWYVSEAGERGFKVSGA